MKKETAGKNIKVGAMVVTGIVLLVVALYFIGEQKNIFGDTFHLKARFKDVNGLLPGNNVRYSGIDVGTVKEVKFMNDSMVEVTMIIEQDVMPYIKKNAVALIGTDGMMGNKLVNINSAGPAPGVTDGDVITSREPVNMDESTRTLMVTNENIKAITTDLRSMTNKLDSSAMWSVLSDTTVAESVKEGAYHFNENMKALKSNFLLKGYFKDKEKEREKAQKKRDRGK